MARFCSPGQVPPCPPRPGSRRASPRPHPPIEIGTEGICEAIRSFSAGTAPGENIELEHVHHFVLEHVLEAGPVAAEELRHPLAQGVGDTPCAFAEIAEDVALREVPRRAENEDGLLLTELMGHEPRQAGIRPLGHTRGVGRHVPAAATPQPLFSPESESRMLL